MKNAMREERVHSHPPGTFIEVGPSGYDTYRSLKTGIVTITPISFRGDRAAYNSSIKNVYQYTPGYGYFKYSDKTATYMGNKKN